MLYDKQHVEKPTSSCKIYPIKTIVAFTALNSYYEAQISSDACINHFSLILSGKLSQYDYMSIFYLLSVATILCLHLRYCGIGDQQAEMLLTRCQDMVPSLKMLDLCSNSISHKGLEKLITIMKNINLTHFSAAGNPIGNAGIQLFSLKDLVQLNISCIGMTDVDTCALSEYFKVNNSLQSLEISDNDIKDNGLAGILNNLPNTLVRLIVSGCNLTYNSAVNICSILRINKTLKHLEISNNAIGDNGISAISNILCFNRTLIQLVACYCQFHSNGAQSIAKMLQTNTTLKYLDISKN